LEGFGKQRPDCSTHRQNEGTRGAAKSLKCDNVLQKKRGKERKTKESATARERGGGLGKLFYFMVPNKQRGGVGVLWNFLRGGRCSVGTIA